MRNVAFSGYVHWTLIVDVVAPVTATSSGAVIAWSLTPWTFGAAACAPEGATTSAAATTA
jgi:hypothetical protein